MTKPLYIILFIIVPLIHKAQTYTTESKNCGACSKEVSIYSKVGMTCPHCGVEWGKENTTRTNSYKNETYSYYTKAIPKKTCNVRSSPSTYASIVASADQNNKFDIVEIKGDWVQIKFVIDSYYGQQTSYGWIYKSLLYLE
jgi:predicted RNA-binding Zn-ribbon protein involved in translation (DUF1610 family)